VKYERYFLTWEIVEEKVQDVAKKSDIYIANALCPTHKSYLVPDVVLDLLLDIDNSWRLVAYIASPWMIIFEREEVQHPSYP